MNSPNEDDAYLSNPGELISDRYQIKSILGQGGFGIVYRALDTVLGREVALKTVYKNLLTDKDLVRFQSEARAMAKVNHPNVVDVYDFGFNEKGDPYLVIEFVQGSTLNFYINERQKLSLEEAVEIITQILKGLKAVHEADLVHRDIKPENIMVEDRNDDSQLHLKLLDFGIARQINMDDRNFQTQTGVAKGSPLYMSPEQILGKHSEKESDIYSIGCLFYRMISGEPPFTADTIFEIMQMHLNQNPKRLKEYLGNNEIVPGMQELMDKMLAKEPQKRFSSVEEVIESLALLSENEPDKNSTLHDDLKPQVMYSEKTFQSNSKLFYPIVLSVLVLIGFAYLWYHYSSLSIPDAETYKSRSMFSNMDGDEISFVYLGKDINPILNKTIEQLSQSKTIGGKKIKCVIIGQKISLKDLTKLMSFEPQYLGILDGNLNEDSWQIISNAPSVKDIRVFANPTVTARSIRYFKNLNLTGIALRKCDLDDASLSVLASIKSLRVIDIEENPKVTVDSVEDVLQLPELKKVFLYGSGLKPENLLALKRQYNHIELTAQHETDISALKYTLDLVRSTGIIKEDLSKVYIKSY